MRKNYFKGPHWEPRGSGYYCRLCGLEMSTEPKDILLHDEVHSLLLQFKKARGFLPMTGEQQEEQKGRAWRILRSATSTQVRADSALEIAEAHYHRELKRQLFQEVPIPEISTRERYLSGYNYKGMFGLDAQTEAIIRCQYPAV